MIKNIHKELFKEMLSKTIKGNKEIVQNQKNTVNEFEKLVEELRKQSNAALVVE